MVIKYYIILHDTLTIGNEHSLFVIFIFYLNFILLLAI